MFEQPNSYSKMLNRIFLSSLIVGLSCIGLLAYLSPSIKEFLHMFPLNVKLGPILTPILFAIPPLLVAIIFRIITLHNMISNLFKIRERFDVNQILLPIAKGVNQKIDQYYLTKIRNKRNQLMRDVFYKYVMSVDRSVINPQYVATALDRWSWFWCFVEPTPIFLLAAVIAWWQIGFIYSLIFIGLMLVFIFAAKCIYPSCKRAAKAEVNEILNDSTRKTEIGKVFNAL
jgi:hypothetical protein